MVSKSVYNKVSNRIMQITLKLSIGFLQNVLLLSSAQTIDNLTVTSDKSFTGCLLTSKLSTGVNKQA